MATWVMEMIARLGYGGLVFLMFLENVFPPIPSELIMPLAGYMAAAGKLSFAGVVAAGTLGSVLGALPLYWAGRKMGERRLKRWVNRHGRWAAVSCEEVDRAGRWFRKHGGAAVFFCRLVPGVRSLIAIPAGIECMNLPAFLAWTTLGSAAWTALLAWLGYLLGGRFRQVESYLDPVSWVVFGVLAGMYLWRVVRFRPAQEESESGAETAAAR
jgi:membrane protein DedA with SNARE-associated domain